MSSHSIRRALKYPVLGGSLLVVALASVASSLAAERLLRSEFDRSLLAKARVLATLTERAPSGISIEFADEELPEFSTAKPREYFELWDGKGKVVERSRSLLGQGLPMPAESEVEHFTDLTLPDGRAGRLVRFRFIPRREERDENGRELTSHDNPSQATDGQYAALAVARGREGVERLVLSVYSINSLAALAITIGLLAIVRRGVNRGLKPLETLAEQVEGLSSERLDARVSIEPAVAELVPIVERLNRLLARLERAFARERQFSSNVAHELRTPISELKSLAEVGARWPEDPSLSGPFFRDALGIAERMAGTTNRLLALARAEAGLEPVAHAHVALAPLIAATWAPFANLASERRLRFEPKIEAELTLTTDREKFGHILSNLLANAVEYSPEDSAIELRAFRDGRGAVHLEISNLAPHLATGDLDSMFTRFWRKDAAGTDAHHSGLGLALVVALCEQLGIAVRANLADLGHLEVRLSKSDTESSIRSQVALRLDG